MNIWNLFDSEVSVYVCIVLNIVIATGYFRHTERAGIFKCKICIFLTLGQMLVRFGLQMKRYEEKNMATIGHPQHLNTKY